MHICPHSGETCFPWVYSQQKLRGGQQVAPPPHGEATGVRFLGWVRCVGCLSSIHSHTLSAFQPDVGQRESPLPREGILVKTPGELTSTHCPCLLTTPRPRTVCTDSAVLPVSHELWPRQGVAEPRNTCADLWLALGAFPNTETVYPFSGDI